MHRRSKRCRWKGIRSGSFLKLRLLRLELFFRVGNSGFGFGGTFPTSLGCRAMLLDQDVALSKFPLVRATADGIFAILICWIALTTDSVVGGATKTKTLLPTRKNSSSLNSLSFKKNRPDSLPSTSFRSPMHEPTLSSLNTPPMHSPQTTSWTSFAEPDSTTVTSPALSAGPSILAIDSSILEPTMLVDLGRFT